MFSEELSSYFQKLSTIFQEMSVNQANRNPSPKRWSIRHRNEPKISSKSVLEK